MFSHLSGNVVAVDVVCDLLNGPRGYIFLVDVDLLCTPVADLAHVDLVHDPCHNVVHVEVASDHASDLARVDVHLLDQLLGNVVDVHAVRHLARVNVLGNDRGVEAGCHRRRVDHVPVRLGHLFGQHGLVPHDDASDSPVDAGVEAVVEAVENRGEETHGKLLV